VTQEEKLVYLSGQQLSCRIELEAMLATNGLCKSQGLYPSYTYDQIMGLFNKYSISHNDILSELYPQSMQQI
jgi:hypothetical protein